MKTYTLVDLSRKLREDLAWRRKEIRAHTDAVRRAEAGVKQAFLRGAVAVLYAHWEGFIKLACQEYLSFVRIRKPMHDDLADCFLAMALKKQLNILSSSKQAMDHIEFVRWWRAEGSRRAYLPRPDIVSTQGNLTVSAFQNLLVQLGLTYRDEYASAEHPIITRLVELRNRLAHGDWSVIDENEWRGQLQPRVEQMMESVCSDIEDAAAKNRHVRSRHQVAPA